MIITIVLVNPSHVLCIYIYICIHVCVSALNDGYITSIAHDEPASPKPVATAISSAHQVLRRASPWP